MAKLDDSNVLVGLHDNPFIEQFDISTDKFTEVNIGFQVQASVVDLGPIVNLFPDQQLQDWINFAAELQGTVPEGARLQCVAKYDTDSLIGGTDTGYVFIWNINSRQGQYASFDVNADEGFSLVDCLERNGNVDKPLVVTIDVQHGRREWTVGNVDYDTHSLTLDQCVGVYDGISAVKSIGGQTVVEGGIDGSVWKRDLSRNVYTWNSRGHFLPVMSIDVLNGRLLTGSMDGTALIWKQPP